MSGKVEIARILISEVLPASILVCVPPRTQGGRKHPANGRKATRNRKRLAERQEGGQDEERTDVVAFLL